MSREARPEFRVEGRRVVVVGGARSGAAAAELLSTRGAQVTVTDVQDDIESREHLESLGVDLELGGVRAESLVAADLVVLSPGVPGERPEIAAARRAGVPVIGEVELASRWLKGSLVAITGTKGKSTTTALAGRMLESGGLKVMVGGNIGRALSSQVAESTPDVVHVVEVSSFQLEQTAAFRPGIAVLLNLFPDHLDRHGSFEAYAAAKSRIFANQEEDDWAVINADDPQALALARGGRARRLCFATESGLQTGIVAADGRLVHRTETGDRPLIPLSAVRLVGHHLLSDVAAAAAVSVILGVTPEQMTRAVENFPGLEHVLEPVAEVQGVRFVNDSKATNVESARRSIESFDGNVVPILGGRFKGGTFADLRRAVADRAVTVVAVGEARARIREALEGIVPVHEAESLASAVRVAFAAARPGGTVLLAPGCASFDMFRDYAERGRVFRQEVSRLARELEGNREQ